MNKAEKDKDNEYKKQQRLNNENTNLINSNYGMNTGYNMYGIIYNGHNNYNGNWGNPYHNGNNNNFYQETSE